MPPIVTSNAIIQCVHGGMVQLIPKQMSVKIQGGFVLCEPDLIGSPIVGCPVPPSVGSKPCLVVVSTIPGISSSLKVKVGGRPAYVQTLSGMTDGVPTPGPIMCTNAGQMSVQG